MAGLLAVSAQVNKLEAKREWDRESERKTEEKGGDPVTAHYAALAFSFHSYRYTCGFNEKSTDLIKEKRADGCLYGWILDTLFG